ncbi:MAG: hypothetical protein ABMA15_18410 [Vicinamibacterales bacterium]
MADTAFSRTLRVFKDTNLSPAGLSRHLAAIMRQERDSLIAKGQASPVYQTFVDGRLGALEETVRPDGVIHYQFSDVAEVILWEFGFVRARSPHNRGAYRDAWALAVDGRAWTGRLEDIPPLSTIMIVNPMPYARKIDIGAMPGMKEPPRIIEAARQAGQRQFPHYTFKREMVRLPSSFASESTGPVPYILAGRSRSFAVRYASSIRASGGRSVKTSRKDSAKGEELTYPALKFSRRTNA